MECLVSHDEAGNVRVAATVPSAVLSDVPSAVPIAVHSAVPSALPSSDAGASPSSSAAHLDTVTEPPSTAAQPPFGKTRVRAASARNQKPCPVNGCPSVDTDMRKHLKCCHSHELSTDEVDRLVKAQPRKKRHDSAAGTSRSVNAGKTRRAAANVRRQKPCPMEGCPLENTDLRSTSSVVTKSCRLTP